MYLERNERSKLSDIILGASAVGIIIYLFRKHSDKDFRSHTTPPIIIKSGIIEIESDQPLDDPHELRDASSQQQSASSSESSESAEVPKILAQRTYKRAGFGLVKTVRIINYKEGGGYQVPTVFPHRNGNRVGIWLQYRQGNVWRWLGNPNSDPDILIDGRSNDFTLISERLSPNESNHHHTRRNKRSYKKDRFYRFGKINVYDFTGGYYYTDPSEERDDIYILEFFDH